jgi:hypothetical protein
MSSLRESQIKQWRPHWALHSALIDWSCQVQVRVVELHQKTCSTWQQEAKTLFIITIKICEILCFNLASDSTTIYSLCLSSLAIAPNASGVRHGALRRLFCDSSELVNLTYAPVPRRASAQWQVLHTEADG